MAIQYSVHSYVTGTHTVHVQVDTVECARLHRAHSVCGAPLSTAYHCEQCVTPLLASFQRTKLLQDKLMKMTTQLCFTELQKAESQT